MKTLWFVIGFVVTTVSIIATEALTDNLKKSNKK